MDVTFSMDDGALSPTEAAQAFAALPDALERKLEASGKDIAQRIRGAAAENAPVDTGQLASSIEGVVANVAGTIVRIRVGTNRDGAAAQEFGTDAGHFPPPSELRDWARRVLGDESAAYPVARSIAETGLDEQPYLRPAVRDNIEFVADRINQAVEDAFAEVGLA